MKRLTDEEKRQLGVIIHFYRNQYFKSDTKISDDFKQVNFCKGICSQAQLSRLEHGEPVKNQEIYEKLLAKFNLQLDKISNKDMIIFDSYFENILTYQNDDQLIINYNEYVLLINKYQNIFKKNIIFTHYNYALEFILAILNEDIEEASYLIELIENNLDILPPKYLVLTLQYLGIYYYLNNDNNKANKFYLLSIEHMHKFHLSNPIIYLEIAYNYIFMNKNLYAINYLNKALDIFYNTSSHVILERIYRCFGIIYIKNKYYNDGINMIENALKFSKKKQIIVNNFAFLAIIYYFKKDYQKALEYIHLAINCKDYVYVDLIRRIIERKLGNKDFNVTYADELFQKIKNFYENNLEEETFEKSVNPFISELPTIIKLIILHDVYLLYKENKKYKKALEFQEQYIL